MSARIQAPRGTFDVLPEQAALREQIATVARELLEPAGYRRIETPTFEATELFARGVGDSTDIVQKEMYTFDDGGGRSLTLRPEGTAPVCRAYVEHGMHRLPAPVKLYYLSSFYRRERAQKGRFRQFWQVGSEAIGSDDPALDAEAIVLLHRLLGRLGARGLRLRLGSLGGPQARAAYREELQDHLRQNAERLTPEVRARIELNPLRAFDSDDAATKEVTAQAPRLLDRLDVADREHFETVQALLGAAEVPFELDATLVRGLDYYTRTVFEFESSALGAQRGVAGGGRYDGLIEQLGGPPTAGIGWAAGIERILLAAQAEPPPPERVDLFLAFEGDEHRAEAFGALLAARERGLRSEMELAGRSLKGQLKHADRIGARHVAIVSDSGMVHKNMDSGDQRQSTIEQLLERVGE